MSERRMIRANTRFAPTVLYLAVVLAGCASGVRPADKTPSAPAPPANATPAKTAPEVAAPTDASETGLQVFAVGFTDLTDTSARLVFSTSEPAVAQVTIIGGNTEREPIKEKEPAEIHRVQIDGLAKGTNYEVMIYASVSDRPTEIFCGYGFTAGLRQSRFDSFDGKTYIGVQFNAMAFEPLAELGAGVVRYSPTWDGIQPKPGEFDAKRIETMVSTVRRLKEMNVEPLVLLCYCVDWAQPCTNRQMIWRNRAFGPPDNLADWKVYVSKVMQELKGLVRYYEVWNEPDAGYLATGVPAERLDVKQAEAIKPIYRGNDEYWLGDRYVPLVTAAREVADSVDPGISVLAGSWNHDYHGSRGDICFGRGMGGSIQQYSFHNYGPNNYPGWEFWTNDKYVFHADRIFAKHKVSMPLAVTEWNMPSYDQPDTAKGQPSRRDGQIFLAKSVFYYLAMERFSILILHQIAFNDEFSLVWKTTEGKIIYTKPFETYRWLCKTFNRKTCKRLPLTTDGGADTRAFAINLPDEGATYIALWQGKYDDKTKASLRLPAREVTAELRGLPDGDYVKETLDLAGGVTASTPVTLKNGLTWKEKLPESTGAAEAEPVVYRIRPAR